MPPFAACLRPVIACCALLWAGLGQAGDAPDWMRAQVAAPLPAHDEKTAAVELYAETVVTVAPDGTITRLERKVFKVLRPDGAARATVGVDYNAQSRVVNLRAWSIPTAGKDFEVKERDAVDISVDTAFGALVGDVRIKQLRIPAAVPGSVIGYESQKEQRPFVLEDEWQFQDTIPVREARYRLQLPTGWSYKATWLNHAEEAPSSVGPGQVEWTVRDVEPIRLERYMPPWRGIAGGLIVALLPPGGKNAGFQTWSEFGHWYLTLAAGRRTASPQLKQKVVELTAAAATQTAKIQALASFVQNDIRYVAIELGIGGFQPHAAAEILSHGYGDCKDKATLLSAMLQEIGVDSYYVIINTARGAVTAATPPNMRFNHAILAIALPPDAADLDFPARLRHRALGDLLFFDPTDYLTPFGRIRGALQANYGVLVAPGGGELVELPQSPPAENSLARTAQMTLDENGTLRGDVHESWLGDRANAQRHALRSARLDTDQIKPVEARVGASFANFQVLKASVGNLYEVSKPFQWNYSIEAEAYAKVGGDLLLIRPRLLGFKSNPLPETTEPRHAAIEFDEPERDTDVFEITVPIGYEIDELPPPIHADTGFAAYDSKTEMVGRVLRYSRTFEIRDLDVPAARTDELQELFRLIARDERATAVFKRVSATQKMRSAAAATGAASATGATSTAGATATALPALQRLVGFAHPFVTIRAGVPIGDGV
jgi:predicted transglutaminase-like cysteine proteinase